MEQKVKMILNEVESTPGIKSKELMETLVGIKNGVKGPLSKKTFYRALSWAKGERKNQPFDKKLARLKWQEKGRETYYYPQWYVPDAYSLCFRAGYHSEVEKFLLDECKKMVSMGLAIESHRVRRIMPPGVKYANKPPTEIKSELKWEEWEFEFKCRSLFRLIVWMERVRGFRIPRTWGFSDYDILRKLYEDEAYANAKAAELEQAQNLKDDDKVIPPFKEELLRPAFKSWMAFFYTAIEYITVYIENGKVSDRETLHPLNH